MVQTFFTGKMIEGILETKDYEKFCVSNQEFESATRASRALVGDTVQVENGAVTSIVKRGSHRGLVGVLEVSSKTKYGFTSRGTPIYLFIPWKESYPPFYVGSNHSTDYPVIAVVDFDSWAPNANCPRGSCRFVIGPCGDLESEQQALLLHYCPNPWKKSVIPPELYERAWKPSITLEGATFHVDPEGCRDIDDAITFVESENGFVDVYIHIADVGSLLLTNPSLWRSADLGQTLYRNGQVAAGLFPESVERACSLLPLETRPTLTLSFRWNSLTSTVSSIEWIHCYIKVKESYTYDSIYETAHEPLLRKIAEALALKPLSDSHDWIAEFMLFYNREAAKCIKEFGEGILRRHGAPDMELLEKLRGLRSIPEHLAFQSGEYCSTGETETSHWGLQQAAYCHASSPIRRYADCINQLSIMKAKFGNEFEMPPCSVSNLNRLSKSAKKYERDLFFLQNVLGWEKPENLYGCILDVSPNKVKIWIENWKLVVIVREPVQGWDLELTVGAHVSLKISVDPKQRNWKRKIVMVLKSLENIND